MQQPFKKSPVTAVVDHDSGKVTAFFNDHPGLLVQGDSLDDVKNKLNSLLSSYAKRINSMRDNLDIQPKQLV